MLLQKTTMLSWPPAFAPRVPAQSMRRLLCVLGNATIMPTFMSTCRPQKSPTKTLCWSLLMGVARAIRKHPSLTASPHLRARLHLHTWMAPAAKEAPALSSFVYWVGMTSQVSLPSTRKRWYPRHIATTMTSEATVLVKAERTIPPLKFGLSTATTSAYSQRSMSNVQLSKLPSTGLEPGESSALCLSTKAGFR